MVTTTRWFFALLAICELTATVGSAVEVRPPLENAITRALQKKVAVDFRHMPLADVLRELATNAAVPYHINVDALRHEDIDPNVLITFNTYAQPIRETLDEILKPHQLDYDARGEELVITTWNEKNEILTQRFFDVSQLVKLIQSRLQSIEVRPINPNGFGSSSTNVDSNKQDTISNSGGFSGEFNGQGFGGGSSDYKRADFRIPLKDAQHRFPAEHALTLIVMENTSGQWEDVDGVGGSLNPSPGRILLRQIETVHQESHIVLSNLERLLRDPKQFPKLRLKDDDTDRERRAALDRIFDTVSDAPAGTISLQKWIDENLVAQGIMIRIDHESLREEEVDLNTVMISLRPGVTRRKLLDDALDAAQLSLRYLDKHFMLVSIAKADEVLDTMVFDVSDLPETGDMAWLNEYLCSSTSGQWEAYDNVGGTISSCGISGLLFVRHTDKVLEEIAERLDDLRQPLEVPAKPLVPQRTRSIYTLPDVVTATDLQAVLPKLVDLPDSTWPEDAIQRVGAMLIVQQTEFVHRRIETVIEALRKAHAAPTPEIRETR
jgi:hypothetical protein